MSLSPIDWERSYGSWGDVLHAYSPRRIAEVLRTWAPRGSPSPRVLELGCAPGRWLRWCEVELHAKCYGVDLNEAGVELTRASSPTIDAVQADAARLPYESGSFDLVFSLGLLEHFEDPQPIVRESVRVLKPGGIHITTTPNIAPGTFQGWHWRTFDRANYEGHRTFTLNQLRAEVERGGLTVLHTEYNGVALPHAQRAICALRLERVARLLEIPVLATSLAVVARKSAGARV